MVALAFGGERQLDLVEAGTDAYGGEATVALDVIHVAEYVRKAAHVFHRGESRELACWARTRVRDILEGKALRVASPMRTYADYLRSMRRICATTATPQRAIPSPPGSSKGRAGIGSATGWS